MTPPQEPPEGGDAGDRPTTPSSDQTVDPNTRSTRPSLETGSGGESAFKRAFPDAKPIEKPPLTADQIETLKGQVPDGQAREVVTTTGRVFAVDRTASGETKILERASSNPRIQQIQAGDDNVEGKPLSPVSGDDTAARTPGAGKDRAATKPGRSPEDAPPAPDRKEPGTDQQAPAAMTPGDRRPVPPDLDAAGAAGRGPSESNADGRRYVDTGDGSPDRPPTLVELAFGRNVRVDLPHPAELESARSRFVQGTAGANDVQTVLRQAVGETRAYFVGDVGGLSGSCLFNACGSARDTVALSLASLLERSASRVSIERLDHALTSRLLGQSHVFVVTRFRLGDGSTRAFIVDASYAQFVGSPYARAEASVASTVRGDPAARALLTQLLERGYIPLTEESARIYLDSLRQRHSPPVTTQAVEALVQGRGGRGGPAFRIEAGGGAPTLREQLPHPSHIEITGEDFERAAANLRRDGRADLAHAVDEVRSRLTGAGLDEPPPRSAAPPPRPPGSGPVPRGGGGGGTGGRGPGVQSATSVAPRTVPPTVTAASVAAGAVPLLFSLFVTPRLEASRIQTQLTRAAEALRPQILQRAAAGGAAVEALRGADGVLWAHVNITLVRWDTLAGGGTGMGAGAAAWHQGTTVVANDWSVTFAPAPADPSARPVYGEGETRSGLTGGFTKRLTWTYTVSVPL